MSFKISEEAVSFIKAKGFSEVTINVANVKGGCVGSFKEIEVRLGKPKDLSKFKECEISGITIYYPDSKFMNERDFILTLDKMLFFKKLVLREA